MDIASPVCVHMINCVHAYIHTQKMRVLRDRHQCVSKSSACGFKERCGCFEETGIFLCIRGCGHAASTKCLCARECSKPG